VRFSESGRTEDNTAIDGLSIGEISSQLAKVQSLVVKE